MEIRRLEKKDITETKKMINIVLVEFFGKELIKDWENFEDYDLFLIVEEDGKIVGSIAIKDCGKGIGKLKRMYVLKEYRNKGIAQKLITRALEFSKKIKLKKITLATDARLHSANHLYEKNGFKVINDLNWKINFHKIENEDYSQDMDKVIFMEKNLE